MLEDPRVIPVLVSGCAEKCSCPKKTRAARGRHVWWSESLSSLGKTWKDIFFPSLVNVLVASQLVFLSSVFFLSILLRFFLVSYKIVTRSRRRKVWFLSAKGWKIPFPWSCCEVWHQCGSERFDPLCDLSELLLHTGWPWQGPGAL